MNKLHQISQSEKKFRVKNIIIILALGSLLSAYVSGYLMRENDSLQKIQSHFPYKAIDKLGSNPSRYWISEKNDSYNGFYLIVSSAQGWGGPLRTGAIIDTSGILIDMLVLNHKETPSFFESLTNNRYFTQYIDKNLSDAFQVKADIEVVSGATVSSKAFARAVGESAHWMGREEFAMVIEDQPLNWKWGANEFILIVFYIVVIISALKKYTRMRRWTLVFGLVFLGFYLNFPISISNFASITLGYFPGIHEYLFWYLLVLGTILLTMVLGKNLYCSWMCPFGGMQEFISIIGGIKFRMSSRMTYFAEKIVLFLFWLSFMIMFLTSNPSLGTFEPFATLFYLSGIGVQWYLVSVAIIGSFLLPRFWCRFFCPVGVGLKYLSQIRGKTATLINKFSEKKSLICSDRRIAA